MDTICTHCLFEVDTHDNGVCYPCVAVVESKMLLEACGWKSWQGKD